VLCGSALRNKGVPPLLDAIVDYLPSPEEVEAVRPIDPSTGESVERKSDPKAPLTMLAYKVMAMGDGRRMTFVRVYSGTLRAGDEVLNVSKGFSEKISRIFLMHSAHRTRLNLIEAGNIVGVLGLKKTLTGDTLTSPNSPVLLEDISGYEPVITQAIEPSLTRDKDKLDEVLARFAEEDPTFRVSEDPDTGQTLVAGMGELHLDIIVDRVRRENDVEVRVGQPQVVYQEAIRATGSGTSTFDRELEDETIFACVTIEAQPLDRNEGVAFEAKFTANWLNDDIRTAIEEGAREAAKSGPIQGEAISDVKLTLTAADHRDGACRPMAYRIAAAAATREAFAAASPALLEPIMAVEIVVPEEFMGEVIGSLNARRGRVEGIEDRAGRKIVQASAALREMFGYTTELRSVSQGRAQFSMRFSHYG